MYSLRGPVFVIAVIGQGPDAAGSRKALCSIDYHGAVEVLMGILIFKNS